MKGVFTSSWLSRGRQWIASLVILFFSACPATTYAQTLIDLPAPGTMITQSQAFSPVMVRAIKIRPDEPLVFDFIVDNGHTGLEGAALKVEVERIAKYFLATVTIPEKDLWVNLSPYEKDRILPDELALTEMGRGMLSQDYILKQLASSLVHPDTDLGKEFWQRVYARAKETLGTTEIPMDTFNKVWIVPEKAVVYERDNAAVLGETRLKLMMEEDYVAFKKGGEMKTDASDEERSAVSKVSSQIMREIVLPEIEKEVNQGGNFALLRQMYGAMILATWYKEALKDSLLAQVYADQKKTAGVVSDDRNMRERIFERYVSAYRQGAFNFIREDVDAVSGEVVPRKYFSGGEDFLDLAQKVEEQKQPLTPAVAVPSVGSVSEATVALAKAAAPDAEESLRTALTVTEADFQELVRQRAQGLAGFHLNVDTSKKFIPAPESAVLNWGTMAAAEKQRLRAKQEEMFRKGQIGEIVMAGGEATRFGGPKTFVEITKELGEFLQVKINNLKWAWKTFGVRAPLYVLSSEKRISEFREKLQARDYYGAKPEDYRWYVQGTVDTFIPSDAELEANFKGDELARYKRFAEEARKANPDGIYRFDGERRLVPAGHFDAIASFIISGQFSDALKRGLEVMPVTNIDNLQAILKNDGMIAAFAESGDDFGFLLAEKNITYEVKEKATGKFLAPKAFVRFRDNVISFDGMNEFRGEAVKDGFRFVINQETKTLDVFDPNNNKVETVLKSKPETGGTLVQYTDENGQPAVTMKEGFELPADFDHEKAPFFNTNTIMIRLKSLLRFLDVSAEELAGMTFDQRSDLVRNRLVKQIKANFEFKNHEVNGEFPNWGVVKDGKTKIPVVQLTRIMLQVVQIQGAKISYIFAPRQEIFAPVKEPEDKLIAAKNNQEALKPYLDMDQAQADVRSAAFQKMFLEKARAGEAVIGLVKPDGQPYEDSLVGEIRATGLRVTQGPKIRMSPEDVQAFYAEHYDVFKATQGREKSWWPQLEALMTSGETTILFIEGPGAVKVMTELKTKVRQSDGRYGKLDSTANRLHASDKTTSAEREAGLMFGKFAQEQRSLEGKFPGLNADAAQTRGGIDFDPALLNMQIERSGEGIRVHVDPAEIQRIKTGGVEGFAPVIINIMPVKGIIPALGLGDQSQRLAGVAG